MIAALAALLLLPVAEAGDTWRGIAVAPEYRCAPYDRDDYRYSQSVEAQIVSAMGGRIYGPYTGRTFTTTRQTHIEHIVAIAEAHDSGLCKATAKTRRTFASDLLNLTLADPKVNRTKSAYDAAEWLPQFNTCWYADRIVQVRRKYQLTIDRREARALDAVLTQCASTEMVFADGGTLPEPQVAPNAEVLRLYDDNRNGRITCREARRHGIAPVRKDHPAYPFMRDGDGDGIVCE